MTMTEKQIRERHAVDDDVRDYPAWVSSFFDLLHPERCRERINHELSGFNASFSLALTRRPPAQLGSLYPPQPDGDGGGESRPHVNLGHDGIGVVDADEAGVVVGREGRIKQQQED